MWASILNDSFNFIKLYEAKQAQLTIGLHLYSSNTQTLTRDAHYSADRLYSESSNKQSSVTEVTSMKQHMIQVTHKISIIIESMVHNPDILRCQPQFGQLWYNFAFHQIIISMTAFQIFSVNMEIHKTFSLDALNGKITMIFFFYFFSMKN